MPCKIKIKENIESKVRELAIPALVMPLAEAKKVAEDINAQFGEDVISFKYYGGYDTIDYDIEISNRLVDNFYNSELILEERDAMKAQAEDATRAGEEFTEDYLFDKPGKVDLTDYDLELAKTYRLVTEESQRQRALEIAQKLGEKFSKAFGTPNQTVSPEYAYELLKDTDAPYQNEPAFYFNRIAYFVDGNFNLNNVLHEYSHPFLKAILISNPTLFYNLYAKLEASDTGKLIIDDLEKEQEDKEESKRLVKGTDRFMEEALVRSMEVKATAKVQAYIKNDKAFASFIDNLIYAIKKIIKKLLSNERLDLKKLSVNTTLDQLVDMMVDQDFVIDTTVIKPSDFAEFNRRVKTEMDTLIEDLKSADAENLINTINTLYANVDYQLKQLQNTPGKLKQALKKGETDGSLSAERILANIKNYLRNSQTITSLDEASESEIIEAVKEQEKEFNIRAINLIRSINEVEAFAKKVQRVIKDFKSNKRHLKEDGVAIIDFYIDFLTEQERFVNEVLDSLSINEESALTKKVLSVERIIRNSLVQSSELQFEGVKNWMLENADMMNESIIGKLETQLLLALGKDGFTIEEVDQYINSIKNRKDLKDFKAEDVDLGRPVTYAKNVADAIREFSRKYVTLESIDDTLRGLKGDIGAVSANVLPYSNINDQMGLFFREMKSQLSDAASKSHVEQNRMIKALMPYLKDLNYNPNNTSQLADLMLFVDKIGIVEDGEFKEFEVYSVMDKFKNWRKDRDELKFNLEKARESKDKTAIKAAIRDLQSFDEQYMNRKYKDEVYEVKKIWESKHSLLDPTTGETINITEDESMDSYLEYQTGLDTLSTYASTSPFTELDDLFEVPESLEAAREYQQLFELYDSFGQAKPLEERKKVLVRLKYREESRKFYEYKPNLDQLQRDFDNFVLTELAAEGISAEDDRLSDPTDPDSKTLYEEYLERFFDKAMRVAYTPEYYDSMNSQFAIIKKLTEKAKNNKVSLQLSALYRKRFVIVNSITDKNGTPNGIELSPEVRKQLKNIETDIEKIKEEFDTQTGLSREELALLANLEKKVSLKKSLTDEEKKTYIELSSVKNEFGLSKAEASDLRRAFTEIAELRETLPTDEYTSAFDDAIGDSLSILEESNLLDAADFPDKKIEQLTRGNYEAWINSKIVAKAKAVNPDFAKWFDQNHFIKKVFNSKINQYVEKYVPIKAWLVVKPANPAHYEETVLIDPITKNEIRVKGKPVSKYGYRVVKDQYMTIPKGADRSSYVGKIIDNKGNYLPKEFALGNPNAKYMNEEYLNLKPSDTRYKLIEAYKREYLKIQQEKPNSSKLYLDLPRLGKNSNLEYIQSGRAREDLASKAESIVSGVKRTFTKTEDAAEFGMNNDTSTQLVETDILGRPITKVPVRGLYKLKLKDVSLDVLGVTSTYLYSLNEQEVLMKNEPLAKALLDILRDPANKPKDVSKASKQINKIRRQIQYLPTSSKENQRLGAVEYYIDRLFYGQSNSDFQENNPVFTKIIKALMGQASRSFVALDVQSALKNRYGMTFQKMIETAGGQYLSYQSAARGKKTAFTTMVELSSKGIYQLGPKSLNIQLTEIFDPVTGKVKKDFGKSTSRTFLKDTLDGSFLLDFRKLTEVSSGLELFFGMMEHKQIEQKNADGTTSKIRYSDAWELDAEGTIKLKDGINPEWSYLNIDHTIEENDTLESLAKKYSTTVEELKAKNKIKSDGELEIGEEIIISRSKLFKDFKLKVQGVGKRLNGLVSDSDNPQASKLLVYNVITFYRKFATGMFLNRFQADMSKDNRWGEVYDWDMGTTTKGYYIQGIQTLIKLISDYKNTYPVLSSDEKTSLKKMFSEVAMVAIFSLLITFLFGYDPGDEDRFDKMRAREERLGALGWLSNEALYLLIMTKRENEMFIPVSGFDEWLDITESFTIFTGPTLNLYMKILNDFIYMATGSEKAVYKQDVGPYAWQEKGKYKLWNHLGSIFGIKGKNISPIWAIKKAEMFENLK